MSKINNLILKYKNLPFKKRADFHNKVTLTTNLIWACLKLILAYFVGSIFISLSGFYTIFIALSKTAYFDGRRNRTTVYSERKHVKRIAFGLILAGLVYLAYFVELFRSPKDTSYDLILSIFLATVAFCEIFFSVIGFFKSKKTKDLLLTSLKIINISSALSSIVLTQIALLSLELTAKDSVIYNTITGMAVGFATIIFAILLLSIGKHKFAEEKSQLKSKNKWRLCKTTLKFNVLRRNYEN